MSIIYSSLMQMLELIAIGTRIDCFDSLYLCLSLYNLFSLLGCIFALYCYLFRFVFSHYMCISMFWIDSGAYVLFVTRPLISFWVACKPSESTLTLPTTFPIKTRFYWNLILSFFRLFLISFVSSLLPLPVIRTVTGTNFYNWWSLVLVNLIIISRFACHSFIPSLVLCHCSWTWEVVDFPRLFRLILLVWYPKISIASIQISFR